MQPDIVIPCFNEEEVLRSTHSGVRSVLEEVKKKKLIPRQVLEALNKFRMM
jgi:hypothetical protein